MIEVGKHYFRELRKLKFGETKEFNDFIVTRVPGGVLYRNVAGYEKTAVVIHICFVPHLDFNKTDAEYKNELA